MSFFKTPLFIVLVLGGCAAPVKFSDSKPKTKEDLTARLLRERIKVRDGIDQQEAWELISLQHDAFEQNKRDSERCMSLPSSRGEQDPSCECRMIPLCEMGCGGPEKCFLSRDRSTAYGVELRRRECFDRGGTWEVYRLTDQAAYGECSR